MNEQFDHLKGSLADRYTIEHELGQGGMATVYLAHDVKHDRKVAVKVLRPELVSVLGAERFLNEIKITANLNHPHILPLLDSGTVEEQPSARTTDRPIVFLYYVMPFVEGESLREKLNREKQLAIEDSIDIAKAVASALDYAHRRSVVHRDIKPENILLHDGQPVVTDFGIALAVTAAGEGRLTETGLALGTPQYMSPEQAAGDRELDGRSDIYSLACVLYEMLAGDPPHTGSTMQAVIAKVVSDRPRDISELRDTVPAHISAALGKALAKLPADRFKTANDFGEALVTPGPVPFTGGGSAPWSVTQKRHRGWWNTERLVWASALAISLAAVSWAFAKSTARVVTAKVVRSTIQLPMSAPISFIGSQMQGTGRRSLAVSPDGVSVVYVGGSEDSEQLYLRLLAEDSAEPIPGTEGATSPFFSWDGQSVGFFVGSELRLVSLRGGQPITLTRDAPVTLGAAWGRDDWIVFTGPAGYELWRISVRGGEQAELVTRFAAGGPSAFKWPSFLPNGRRVLTCGIVEDVWVSDTESGTSVRIAGLMASDARYVSSGHLLFTQGSELLAVPFDLEDLEIVGSPVAILSGLRTEALGAAQFDVSRTGTLVYAPGRSAAEGRLVKVGRDASVDSLPFETQRFGPMRYSPDGTRLAITVSNPSRAVWIYDLVRNAPLRLTPPRSQNGAPVWSPDGRYVAFWSDREGPRVVFIQPVDGPGEARRISGPWEESIPESWSGNGYLALDVFNDDTGWDVEAIAFGTDTSIVDVAASTSLEWGGAFSPDGRWIAYTTDEPGDYHVFVQSFPEASQRMQVSVTPGSEEPSWSPDGRVIYYRNGEQWMAVDVSTEPTLSVGTPRRVFEGDYINLNYRSYDVAPDGSGFVLVAGPAEESQSRLQLVQGWFGELEELVPRR